VQKSVGIVAGGDFEAFHSWEASCERLDVDVEGTLRNIALPSIHVALSEVQDEGGDVGEGVEEGEESSMVTKETGEASKAWHFLGFKGMEWDVVERIAKSPTKLFHLPHKTSKFLHDRETDLGSVPHLGGDFEELKGWGLKTEEILVVHGVGGVHVINVKVADLEPTEREACGSEVTDERGMDVKPSLRYKYRFYRHMLIKLISS
jgi:hypothetical protein